MASRSTIHTRSPASRVVPYPFEGQSSPGLLLSSWSHSPSPAASPSPRQRDGETEHGTPSECAVWVEGGWTETEEHLGFYPTSTPSLSSSLSLSSSTLRHQRETRYARQYDTAKSCREYTHLSIWTDFIIVGFRETPHRA